MSMTAEATKWHQVYEELEGYHKLVIDHAFEVARHELRQICEPANDDRAEELVAAITKFYKESNDKPKT